MHANFHNEITFVGITGAWDHMSTFTTIFASWMYLRKKEMEDFAIIIFIMGYKQASFAKWLSIMQMCNALDQGTHKYDTESF